MNPLLSGSYGQTYQEMLEAVARHPFRRPFQSIDPFWPLVGNKWSEPGMRILVVGRAVNTWEKQQVGLDQLQTEDGRAEVLARVRGLSDPEAATGDVMRWIERREGDSDYNTRRSAFWRVMKMVASNFYPIEPGWSEKLAYSNLAKLAPSAGGNPGNDLWKAQRSGILKLFEQEIWALAPHLVLVMTGWDWFAPFAEKLGVSPRVNTKALVQAAFSTGGAVCIVTKHPQGKPEVQLVEEVMRAYSKAITPQV